jgi:hypothetical protein
MQNSTTKSEIKPRGGQVAKSQEASAGEAAMELLRDYTRQRPDVVVLWAFGIGFVLGWKLKPW